MTTYIIRRLIQAIIVVFLVTLIIFFLMRLVPGDPIVLLVGADELAVLSDQEVDMLRHDYGLDRPVVVQYVTWLSGVVRGDLGDSLHSKAPVSKFIVQSLPITLYLGIIASIISVILGISSGAISSIRRATLMDTGITIFANLGITVPIFWLGFLLMYVFGLRLGVLPIYGYTSPFENLSLSLKQAIMPVVCLAAFGIGAAARQTRSSMLEVIKQDYIRTAWSKGLRERQVIMKHALKNSLIPVITLTGITVRNIIGGSVLVETVFNIPGMGRLAVDAVLTHDYMMVQGVVLLLSVVVTGVNLLIDLTYGWLDPRIRYS
jgi:peptide/nickel transport system permease protein